MQAAYFNNCGGQEAIGLYTFFSHTQFLEMSEYSCPTLASSSSRVSSAAIHEHYLNILNITTVTQKLYSSSFLLRSLTSSFCEQAHPHQGLWQSVDPLYGDKIGHDVSGRTSSTSRHIVGNCAALHFTVRWATVGTTCQLERHS
jgi:hypothetical protein